MTGSARVAAIGECMVELSHHPEGGCTLGFGGDTFNTALYLARLGIGVDYVTALGDDPYSERMLAAWAAEGIGTNRILRLPGRMPGLYAIETDAAGERRFYYWRDSSAARDLFSRPESAELAAALAGYKLLYLSGISLSLYGEAGRAVLFEAIDRARAQGARVAFDTNYRPRGWPDAGTAQRAFAAMLDRSDIVLAGMDDLGQLWGLTTDEACLARLAGHGIPEIVLRLTPPGCRIAVDDRRLLVPAESGVKVVDTTAAGDSFNAGYLAGRLLGEAPEAAARRGHRLAAAVIGHRGAIIPRAAMPDLDLDARTTPAGVRS